MHFCRRSPQCGRRIPEGTVVGLEKADCTPTLLNSDTTPKSYFWELDDASYTSKDHWGHKLLTISGESDGRLLLSITVHVKRLYLVTDLTLSDWAIRTRA